MCLLALRSATPASFSARERNKTSLRRSVLVEGKGTEKRPEMFMIYRNVIAATILVTVCILAGSNAMAQRHGGFSGGGFRGGGSTFGRAGFNSGGFRGGFNGHGFRGDRFRHRDFDDRFVFFGDFGDPFFYYPYPYYGYYPYGYYPYGYGYNSYDQPVYQGSAGYTDSLTGQVQVRLARAGYYHGAIDGVSGNATRRAIREYERAHSLPADGQIRGRLLTTMGLG
jgi:Putative peptidoglycan binding domain